MLAEKQKKENANIKKPNHKPINSKPVPAGGQAVIDGVMMKTPHYYSLAVRKPDSSIHLETHRHISFAEKRKFLGWPFFRGPITLFEMLSLGLKALMRSAEIASADEEGEEELSWFAMVATIGIAVIFAVGLFVFLPYAITYYFGFSEDKNALVFNIVDGLIKILFFVAYVYLISLMKDIRRTFQYHGAEHKTINCFEDKKSLTPENCMKYKTFHARCGTSFVMIVFFIMIFIFSGIPFLLDLLFPSLLEVSSVARRAILFFIRLLFIIPVASVSYEILKLSFKFENNLLMKIFVFPGRLLQGITTREPTRKQVEVAIASLKAALSKESSYKK